MTLGKDLAYVALVVNDSDMTAGVLGHLLGLKRNDIDDGTGQRIPVFAIGESALALFPQGHPGVGGETRPGVHHIALGVDHLDSGLAIADKAGVPVSGKPETGLGGRKRVVLAPELTAGIRTWITERVSIDRAKAPEELYAEGSGADAFRRTASRLVEMRGEDYLQRGHGLAGAGGGV